ncbi:MAG: regulatory protein GemA [Candidatus Gastranaerophilaceae bacterium]
MSDKLSTAKQRQDLGYMRKLMGFDDDIYYEMMFNRYGVRSSKDLTQKQINEYINYLRDNAIQTGAFKPKASFNKYKYNNLANRDKKMASPKQLRKIEAMWLDRTKAKTNEEKAKALKSFIKRITGKEGITFLTAVDVRKIINALENM